MSSEEKTRRSIERIRNLTESLGCVVEDAEGSGNISTAEGLKSVAWLVSNMIKCGYPHMKELTTASFIAELHEFLDGRSVCQHPDNIVGGLGISESSSWDDKPALAPKED